MRTTRRCLKSILLLLLLLPGPALAADDPEVTPLTSEDPAISAEAVAEDPESVDPEPEEQEAEQLVGGEQEDPEGAKELVEGEPVDDRPERIGALLADVYPVSEPGVAVIVTDNGTIVYRGARGMANIELGVPLEPDMVFRLGSITKQFTAAAVLLLEERGELSVDDPITDYLPDYPVHGHTITIEHLLTHTSGIFSNISIPRHKLSEVRRDLTTEALIDGFKREEMEFAPGRAWSYSNSGYVLLGAIIEEVSGLSYAEFLRRHIFEPLRLDHSHHGGHQLIPRRVAGYRREGVSYVNAHYLSMTQPHAAGALLSNVDDLALWNAALDSDLLLSDASRQKMFEAHRLADGEATEYGYGFRVGTLRGSPMIFHGGGIFGFATFAIRLPDEGVYVAVLQNGSPANPSLVARKIAALAIGKPFPERQRVDLAPEILERYAGVYRIDDEITRTVTVEGGRLYTQRTGAQRVEALPYSETGFFYPGSLTYFEIATGEQGEVRMLTYHDGADEPETAERLEPAGVVGLLRDEAPDQSAPPGP